MNKKYTSILFDLDNTLIDTDPIRKKTLKKCECKEIADISLKDLRSLSPPNLLRKYGGNYANYWKYYEKYLSDVKPIDPKLPKILDVIKKLNTTLGIITSSPIRIATIGLKMSGLSLFFSNLFGYKRGTTKASLIKRAVFEWKCTPQNTIYIGEAESDLVAGKNASIDFGLAMWGMNPLDAYLLLENGIIAINQVEELLNLI